MTTIQFDLVSRPQLIGLVPSDVLDSTSAMRPGDRLEQTGRDRYRFAMAIDGPLANDVTVKAEGNVVYVRRGDRTVRHLALKDRFAYQGATIASDSVHIDLQTRPAA
ncbi:MAG: hypothetical protein AB7O56_10250 [Bauldia sp.]